MTVNLAESPLGWLYARGHLSRRQFDAGREAAPGLGARAAGGAGDHGLGLGAGRPGAAAGGRPAPDLSAAQIDARRRFQAAIDAAGPGLADILWRIVCSGEGMRDAETALGWPARAGKVVLTIALDRVADFYRIR